jgi:chemotaxis protein CheX
MDVRLMNAFIGATRQLMELVVDVDHFEKKSLQVDEQMETLYDISALIGLTGDYTGSLVLSVPEGLALLMLHNVTGEEITTFDADACDTMGELLNIIVGNTLERLAQTGNSTIRRSVPNTVVGRGHHIWRPHDAPCISVVFATNGGEFSLQMSITKKER